MIKELVIPKARAARSNTLHARAEEFLEFKMHTSADGTWKIYKQVVNGLLSFVEKSGTREVGPRTIYRFFIEERRGGRSENSLAFHRTLLHHFFDWLRCMGFVDVNPVESLPSSTFRASQPKHKTFTDEEYDKLKRVAVGTELYYALVCAWHTAMRMSDICLLRWEDVDFNTGLISILPHKTRRTGKRATIPIHPELREILGNRQAVMKPGEAHVSEELSTYYLRDRTLIPRMFRQLLDKAGIEKGRGFHAIRHTVLERWMNHPNADTITVMDLSGHKSASTLARYCQPSVDKKLLIMGLSKPEHDSNIHS